MVGGSARRPEGFEGAERRMWAEGCRVNVDGQEWRGGQEEGQEGRAGVEDEVDARVGDGLIMYHKQYVSMSVITCSIFYKCSLTCFGVL